MKVSGDVVVVGLANGGVVVCDLESGIELSEVPGDPSRGRVVHVQLACAAFGGENVTAPDANGRYKLPGKASSAVVILLFLLSRLISKSIYNT